MKLTEYKYKGVLKLSCPQDGVVWFPWFVLDDKDSSLAFIESMFIFVSGEDHMNYEDTLGNLIIDRDFDRYMGFDSLDKVRSPLTIEYDIDGKATRTSAYRSEVYSSFNNAIRMSIRDKLDLNESTEYTDAIMAARATSLSQNL